MRYSFVGLLLITIPVLHAVAQTDSMAAQDLHWPPAPDPARIRYLEFLPGAVPPRPEPVSFFRRSVRFLFGIGPEDRKASPVFVRPTGVWVRGNTAYVADPGRRVVVKYDMARHAFVDIPKPRHLRLLSPVSVVVTKSGARMLISDSELKEVFVLSVKGKLRGNLSVPGQRWLRPTGLALDEERDRIYVADTARHRISIFTISGEYLRSFGERGGGPGQFNFPTYLWATPRTGHLLVCDSMNFRIQIFDADGKHLGGFGTVGNRPGFLSRPRGLCQDSDGNVYVVDAAMETVQVFSQEGKLLLYFGMNGTGPGSFSLPGGIFVDGNDRVYVADTYNARLQVFQYIREDQP